EKSGPKTSSLFRNNPEIPQVHRATVSQVEEEIFTSDTFTQMSLHPHLVTTLNNVFNVSTVTSVQRQTIPVLLSGRDALVRSQTGSEGKTLSYAIPVVQSLQALQPKVSRGDGPLALILVPTRELAQQTFVTFQKLLKPFTWVVPGVLMGGEKRKAEKARLRKGINILVSTPGRLVDHIRNTLSISFSAVRWLVLDEADRTLDLGFEKDLSVILNSVNSAASSRQNVLLVSPLSHRGVTRLAGICLKDSVSVAVSGPALSEPASCSPPTRFAVPEALQQFVVVVPSKVRLVCLAAFILGKCKFSQNNKVIVFVSSCETAEFLYVLFSAVLRGSPTNQNAGVSFLRLHGNMQQEERTDVFQRFAASASGVLLCTDVAARGLDLPRVTWILQYTPPMTAAEYVHRVGRTARVGQAGSSLIFLTPAETAFVEELANHSISLSEIKLLDILSSLMMDDTYKGRGKYHSKTSSRALEQETRERATVLQTDFETFVHGSAGCVAAAQSALQSFLRAYTTYPARLKHIFHIRSLHLGHTAKSFALREAPQALGAARLPPGGGAKSRKRRSQNRPESQLTGSATLLRSEFSSGNIGSGNAVGRGQNPAGPAQAGSGPPGAWTR
uniref:ATP-dependent RNA helicase n=1 Tax=Tetraodon nigroviridis TaxID=99883 RepID=H3CKK3_TETNG